MKSTADHLRSVSDVGDRLRVAATSEFSSSLSLGAEGRVPSSSPRSGFTLTEILVVIVIIAILAALITPALSAVLWSARQTKIKVEVDQLASAIEAYKAKYGSYPPANLVISATA